MVQNVKKKNFPQITKGEIQQGGRCANQDNAQPLKELRNNIHLATCIVDRYLRRELFHLLVFVITIQHYIFKG